MAEDYRDIHVDRGGHYDATLAASAFDNYMTLWEEKHVRELLPRVCPNGIDRYLDFACGTGRLTRVIADYAREVVGVDISATMLEAARPKLPRARFVLADLTSETVELGQFDLVSSFRFFGNAEPALRAAVLRALSPMVRMGGHLLVNNHRNPWALMNVFDRLTGGTADVHLTPRIFRRILADAGFDIVETRPIAVWQYRSKLAAQAGSQPDREARLEQRYGGSFWAPIAPDAVILARKVRSHV